ncbi:DedA family protein [Salinifilum ghardaiensis]
MSGAALDLLEQVIASPWVYLVLLALAGLDGFFPVVPGETALVTAAVLAGSHSPDLPAIIAAGTAGAFLGDHVAYLIGRSPFGQWLAARLRSRPRGRAAFAWADATLTERGGQVLLASRYVPGVRTATTLTLGGVRYPWRKFALFDVLAAGFWATGWTLVGYLGGAAFGGDGLSSLAFGIGLACALMLLSEVARRLWRYWRGRRGRTAASEAAETSGIGR